MYAKFKDLVAPHVGAWIEIDETVDAEIAKSVAPHVGAWIEIFCLAQQLKLLESRTPRGCVD